MPETLNSFEAAIIFLSANGIIVKLFIIRWAFSRYRWARDQDSADLIMSSSRMVVTSVSFLAAQVCVFLYGLVQAFTPDPVRVEFVRSFDFGIILSLILVWSLTVGSTADFGIQWMLLQHYRASRAQQNASRRRHANHATTPVEQE